jgi:hypothetical protein
MIAEQFLTSSSKRTPLRIGLLLDGLVLPRYVAQIIEYIKRSNFATLELLVIRNTEGTNPETSEGLKPRLLSRFLSDPICRRKIAYQIYRDLDKKYFLKDNHPLERLDCRENLSAIETLAMSPLSRGCGQSFNQSDVKEIQKRELDVILKFGFRALCGDVVRAARYGIWSYLQSDSEYYSGGPARFWELYEGSKLSGVTLRACTNEKESGIELGKALFSTTQDGISVTQNELTPIWGSVHLVIQKLYELHEYGWDYLAKRAVPKAPYRGKRASYTTPTNLEMLRWIIRALTGKSWRWGKRIFTREKTALWRIGMRNGGGNLVDEADPNDRCHFRWLAAPRGHYYADPFLVEYQGRTWLFCEDYNYCEGKAIIVCREVLRNGELGDLQTVLNRPYHLSYPYVFRHEANFYLIPESASNGTVELYRATDFPRQWIFEKVLFRGKAVDTTFFTDGDTFWFFTTLKATVGDGICLFLFYSNRIDGEWSSHPANPISTDVRDARCAGRVFRHEGKLIRISQDCSGRYGSSFSFREIVTLSKTDYQEKLLHTVTPWTNSIRGTHTYNSCSSFEVIDGLMYEAKSKLYLASAV